MSFYFFEIKFHHFSCPVGLSFGVEAIMALDGTLLFEEIMQAKEVFYFQIV